MNVEISTAKKLADARMNLFLNGGVCMRAMLNGPGFKIACYKNRSAILCVAHKPRLPHLFLRRMAFISFMGHFVLN